MSTNSWTLAPAGYLESAGLAASPVDGGGAGCSVAPLVQAWGSGLPAVGVGVPMHTAAPFGIQITSIVPRFDSTPLGIRSSRRPSS
jgi:hypothetical protein